MLLQNKTILVTNTWITGYGNVNKGFISDGVSTPWIFRWFIHRRGELLYAAIYHDWAYDSAYISKEYADTSFYKLAILTGASKFKAKIAYYVVKIFGKGNYQ